ncbi:MAG: hypothetical protein KatS3mg023_1228 [Armatimonadota bacterium]|nr:MAG: hypothetical protein KatS3mg023_1228 [Armatimonadota bacterium]
MSKHQLFFCEMTPRLWNNQSGVQCTVRAVKGILQLLLLVFLSVVAYAQQSAQVFPSAKWAWYLVREGPDGGWPAGGMSKDDITRWIAAHGDWMLGASPRYGSPSWNLLLEANANLRFTLYDEWFYADPTTAHPNYNQVAHWSTGWIDGRVVQIEDEYLSRGQNPETAFFHVSTDYHWQDVTVKFYEDQILSAWRQEGSTNTEILQMDPLYRCEGQTLFTLPTTVGSSLIFGRPEPYDSIYLEFDTPASEGQYVIEYVNGTSFTSSNFEMARSWAPVAIISDGTSGFTRSGWIRFQMPNRWTQWKRCGISTAASNTGKYYWIRIRCTVPPRNTPSLRGAWTTPYYRYLPSVKNVGEAIYLGFPSPVTSAEIQLLSAGDGGSYVLEYASAAGTDGSTSQWSPLTSVSDGTNSLTKTGTISWSAPAGWIQSKVNVGKAPKRYWIRIRVTSAPTTPAVVASVRAGGRSLYSQEIYAIRYRLIIPGWDERNDSNGDGYVDDQEYATLVNPAATARWAAQARVVRIGWQGALNYVINWAKSELREVMLGFYNALYLGNPDTHVHGLLSDSLVMPIPSPMLTAAVESSDAQQWESMWLEAHRYLRHSGKKIGGNLGSYEVFAPLSQQQAYLDNGFYTHLYNDFVMHEHYPQGRIYQTTEISFRRRLLNISMETGAGLDQVLQFNMAGDALLRIGGGTDATAWKRFQEHALAFFYLVQHPQRSYLNIWQTAVYGADVMDTPIGTMPKPMAFQPTAMLQVDIGQPANSIPNGFAPVQLMYREGGGFPDNIVVGDTASPVLNNNYPKLAGKPVYPTYVFALASGTLPNRPSTTYTVFARKYTKGLVLLKMTSKYEVSDTGDGSATTHPLPGVYRRVRWDGTLSEPITEITLRGMEGAILVDASQTASDLQISTSVDKPSARPGEVLRVTVTVSNPSAQEVRNAVITLPLPSSMTYRRGSLKVNGNAVSDPSDPSRVQVTLRSVASGGSARVEFEATIK